MIIAILMTRLLTWELKFFIRMNGIYWRLAILEERIRNVNWDLT